MKCDICGFDCDGSLVIRTTGFITGDIITCTDCFNDYGNQEWNKLTKKLDKKVVL